MVQHVEALARIAGSQGALDLAHDLKQVVQKHRGISPEVLEGVTVYDKNSEETEHLQTVYSNSELKYDLELYVLEVQRRRVALRRKEHEVLRFLIQNAGRVVTYRTFGENLWSLVDDININRAVRKHIRGIRRRVKDTTEKELESIVSVYGVGYKLVDPIMFS